jgi:hypothetical protein
VNTPPPPASELAVLRVLTSRRYPGLWLTAAGVATLLGITEATAAEELRSLRRRALIVQDDRRPRAYARTRRGDELLSGELQERPPRRAMRRAGRARKLAEVRLAGGAG